MKPDIAAIKARADKATEGPWKVEKYYHEEPEFIKSAAVVTEPDKEGCQYTITRNNWSNPLLADLDFIAHARTDIPALLAYIEQLEAERQWVPVSERLPEKSQRVLAYSPAMSGTDAEIQINKGFMCHGKRTDITHWMPLPPLPEDNSNV